MHSTGGHQQEVRVCLIAWADSPPSHNYTRLYTDSFMNATLPAHLTRLHVRQERALDTTRASRV
jgi:hypothetical protein